MSTPLPPVQARHVVAVRTLHATLRLAPPTMYSISLFFFAYFQVPLQSFVFSP